MLMQFTVSNFLSFKEETTFSMLPVENLHQLEDHILTSNGAKRQHALRAAAIYGANASGKSNLVRAIAFAQQQIVKGVSSGIKIPVIPFRPEIVPGKPSRFQFIFVADGIRYTYGFVVNSTKVLEEWLTAYEKAEKTLFERSCQDSEDRIEFGPSMRGRSKQREEFLKFVAQGTRPNRLFLTEAIDRNVTELQPVMNWFQQSLAITDPDSEFLNLELTAQNDQGFTAFLEELLRNAGTAIDSISTKETPVDLNQYFQGARKNVVETITQRLHENKDGKRMIFHDSSSGKGILYIGADGNPAFVELITHHHVNGKDVPFALNEESDGTQRLIHLAPLLYNLIRRKSFVCIIDELDRRLHPMLSRQLIQLATQCREIDSLGQIIFTTHETSLLDLELLRRDEIWFADKAKDGATHLYSLAEFRIRPDLKIEKGYINGRFGAIPFLGDVKKLLPNESKDDAFSYQ